MVPSAKTESRLFIVQLDWITIKQADSESDNNIHMWVSPSYMQRFLIQVSGDS